MYSLQLMYAPKPITILYMMDGEVSQVDTRIWHSLGWVISHCSSAGSYISLDRGRI